MANVNSDVGGGKSKAQLEKEKKEREERARREQWLNRSASMNSSTSSANSRGHAGAGKGFVIPKTSNKANTPSNTSVKPSSTVIANKGKTSPSPTPARSRTSSEIKDQLHKAENGGYVIPKVKQVDLTPKHHASGISPYNPLTAKKPKVTGAKFPMTKEDFVKSNPKYPSFPERVDSVLKSVTPNSLNPLPAIETYLEKAYVDDEERKKNRQYAYEENAKGNISKSTKEEILKDNLGKINPLAQGYHATKKFVNEKTSDFMQSDMYKQEQKREKNRNKVYEDFNAGLIDEDTKNKILKENKEKNKWLTSTIADLNHDTGIKNHTEQRANLVQANKDYIEGKLTKEELADYARTLDVTSSSSDIMEIQEYEHNKKAREGLGKVGNFAVDVAQTTGRMGTMFATPVPGLAIGVSTASDVTKNSIESGERADNALAYGIASALTSVGIEKLGGIGGSGNLSGSIAHGISKVAPSGVKAWLAKDGVKNIAKIANGLFNFDEALEEGLEYPIQKVLEGVFLEDSTPIDVKQWLMSMGVGGVVGSVMTGGVNSAVDGATTAIGTAIANNDIKNNGQRSLADIGQNEVKVGDKFTAQGVLPQSDMARRLQLENDTMGFTQNSVNRQSVVEQKNNTIQDGESGQPIKVGKTTTIKNPYIGQIPVTDNNVMRNIPTIKTDDVDFAREQIELAKQGDGTGKSVKRFLKDIYNNVFDNTGGVRDISVTSVTFSGEEYVVALNKSIVSKVVSDYNMSPEKLSVFNNLDEVISNAEYVGSSKYEVKNGKVKPTIRFDYFETPTKIGSNNYVVSFDVEVFKDTNNYRTHKVIKNVDLTQVSNADVGPNPTADDKASSPSINSISQGNTIVNSNSMQNDDNYANEIVDVEQVKSIAKNHGVQIKFVDGLDNNVNGMYKDGKVIISTKNKQPLLEVAKHELTHHINNTKFHGELNDFVLNYMKENNVDIDGVKNKLIKVYADNGIELDEQGVNNELVAKFVGSKLFTNDSSIKRLAQTKPDLFTTIKNWISDMAVKFTGTTEEKTYRDLEKRYIKALGEVKGVDRNSDEQYSIRTDANGDKYVNIDEDILKGVPKSDWKTKVKAVLKEKFSNGFTLDEYGTNIKVNATSRNELTQASQGVKNEDPKHKRNDSLISFNRGKVRIQVGENSYSADVVTGIDKYNNEVFYDVIGIKPTKIVEASQIASLDKIQTAKTESTSTTNSISQSDSSVNTNSMQNSKKYSLGDDDFDNLISEHMPPPPKSEQYKLVPINDKGDTINVSLDYSNAVMPDGEVKKASKRSIDIDAKNRRRTTKWLGDLFGIKVNKDGRKFIEDVQDNLKELKSDENPSNYSSAYENAFAKLINEGIIKNSDLSEQYKDLKKYLRQTGVAVEEIDKKSFEDFSQIRKSNMQKLKFANNGVPLDTFFAELQSNYPELFSQGEFIGARSKIEKLVEVANLLKVNDEKLNVFTSTDPIFKKGLRDEFDALIDNYFETDMINNRAKEDSYIRHGNRYQQPILSEEVEKIYRDYQISKRILEHNVNCNMLSDNLDDNLRPYQVSIRKKARNYIDMLHDGTITLENIATMAQFDDDINMNLIKEVYAIEAEFKRAQKLYVQHRTQIENERVETVRDIIEDTANWKDKATGFQFHRERTDTNFEDVIANRKNPNGMRTYQAIREWLILPMYKNEADKMRLANECDKKVKQLNLNQFESVLEPYLSEGKISINNVNSLDFRLWYKLLKNKKSNLSQIEETPVLKDLYENLKAKDIEPYLNNPVNTDKMLRANQVFDEIYNLINKLAQEQAILAGEAIFPERKNYRPHFNKNQESEVLSTEIAGATADRKPNKPFSRHAQARTGDKTIYDGLAAYKIYMNGTLDLVFHTNDIKNMRTLERELRLQHNQDNFKEMSREIERNDTLNEEQKLEAKQQLIGSYNTQLPNFVSWLGEVTNTLAHKKSLGDRATELYVNRTIYDIAKITESRTRMNMVGKNLSSAITNLIPLVQVGTPIKKQYLVKGLVDYTKGIFRDDGFAERSDFLMSRRGRTEIIKPTFIEWINSKEPMNCIDNFVTELLVRSKYLEEINKHGNQKVAMQNADEFVSKGVGDRSIVMQPQIFNLKNPVASFITAFQLEVNNLPSYFTKTLPRVFKKNYSENPAKAIVGGIAHLFSYLLSIWLLDEMYENVIGRKVLGMYNPVGTGIDFADDLHDYNNKDIEQDEFIKRQTKVLVDTLPFLNNLAGFMGIEGGRLPIAGAIPNIEELSKIGNDKIASNKKWDIANKELLQKLPLALSPIAGANQFKKTALGIQALVEGGSYKINDKGERILQYPVDNNVWNSTQAVLFGKSATKGAREWVDGGFNSLSAEERKERLHNDETLWEGGVPEDTEPSKDTVSAATSESNGSINNNSGSGVDAGVIKSIMSREKGRVKADKGAELAQYLFSQKGVNINQKEEILKENGFTLPPSNIYNEKGQIKDKEQLKKFYSLDEKQQYKAVNVMEQGGSLDEFITIQKKTSEESRKSAIALLIPEKQNAFNRAFYPPKYSKRELSIKVARLYKDRKTYTEDEFNQKLFELDTMPVPKQIRKNSLQIEQYYELKDQYRRAKADEALTLGVDWQEFYYANRIYDQTKHLRGKKRTLLFRQLVNKSELQFKDLSTILKVFNLK